MQRAQLIEKGMTVAIEPVQKQVFNEGTAEFPGRQTDIVNDQQIDRLTVRPIILVRRHHANRIRTPSVLVDIHGKITEEFYCIQTCLFFK